MCLCMGKYLAVTVAALSGSSTRFLVRLAVRSQEIDSYHAAPMHVEKDITDCRLRQISSYM